jgi:ribulose-bisphosphate carboxylase large chain
VELSYKPSKSDLVCLFRIRPNNASMREAASQVAAESSVGTWTEVQSEKRIRDMGAKVFSIRGEYAKIAYPGILFETMNMPQIMASIAGNIMGMKVVDEIRLEDIDFPDYFMKEYKGPEYGIEGVRKYLGIKKRPLVGSIIKPKIGLRTKQHAKVAYETWIGGCDIIKDDENLSNQGFNPFKERVVETLAMRDNAISETGNKKAYMPNVTAETEEMLERMDYVRSQGGKYAMVDVITTGFSALQTVRKHSKGMILHAHRAMHGAITRGNQGVSMLALAKIYRLIGVDQLHIGTAFGKMEGGKREVFNIGEEIEEKFVRKDLKGHVLSEKWGRIKPVFAVCSGGIHPGLVPPLVKTFGSDIIIQAGGGVHGHPDGSMKGAMAMRQAVDAVMKNISLEEYSKEHIELRRALGLWDDQKSITLK